MNIFREILVPRAKWILVGLVAVGALLVFTPGCKTLESFTLPGCQDYATAQVKAYIDDGWQVAQVAPLSEGSEFVLYAKPTSDGRLTLEGWVFRLDGASPSDEELTENQYVQVQACSWDGPTELDSGVTTGSFWRGPHVDLAN